MNIATAIQMIEDHTKFQAFTSVAGSDYIDIHLESGEFCETVHFEEAFCDYDLDQLTPTTQLPLEAVGS